MTPDPDRSATVVIPTFNGERYLDAILTAIEQQDYRGGVETLVIDSGSTDGTLDIVRSHPAVRLHEIPNSEFGHGRTRDLAARLATGRFVAYLTHDAVPADSGWLGALLAPMLDDERIVAVMGKQVPRAGCDPMQKYAMEGLFHWLGPDFGVTVFRDDGTLDDPLRFEAAGYYSDANSAARRDILTGAVPYRYVAYSEDQLFGRDLLRAGYRKAYAPAAAVIHSNDLGVRGTYRRAISDIVGLRRIGSRVPSFGVIRMLARAVKGTFVHGFRVLRDRDYPPTAKVRWFFVNPAYELAQWIGQRRGTLVPVDVDPAVKGA